ncbi:Clp protease N-terminal domain-containing protein [Actinosynnema sp. NPDC020468]|uniref:Clp protease N-terminal domain-containing protein n=1 Tax=Actinosynnema sp. NPDC020468 TaxID=3154488 RepID=UPI0033C73685
MSVHAKDEAHRLAHDHIGTEHLLLGLLRQSTGTAARVLTSFGLTAERCARHAVAVVGRGRGAGGGHLPFTPRAKKSLELAVRQALEFGHDHVATEHLLLGLLGLTDGGALDVLARCGVRGEDVRERVLAVLAGFVVPQPRPAVRVFLRYRHEDRHLAGRIGDALDRHLGGAVVEDVRESDVQLLVVSPEGAPPAETSATTIPVLVDGAPPPVGPPHDNRVELRHETFLRDVTRLADLLRHAQPAVG